MAPTWAQVGSPNRSKIRSKLNLDTKKPPTGPQRPLGVNFGPSGGQLGTLQGSISNLPGTVFSLLGGSIFDPPDDDSVSRVSLPPSPDRLSTYLAASCCCYHGVPGSMGRRVPALALTISWELRLRVIQKFPDFPELFET